MKKRLLALLAYAIFWLVFFFFARLFFVLTHFSESSAAGGGQIALTFIHGLLLDISATGYIFLIPLLILIPGVPFNGNWFRTFIKLYTWIIIAVSSIIIVTDTLLYKYWGFRMDYTPLLYLKTPKEAAASVTAVEMTGVLAGILTLSALFIFIYNRFIDRFFDGFSRIRLWLPAVFAFLILWGSLIIPIRGGIGIAPINAGTVYFSSNTFVNHTAINVVWNVGSSAVNNKPTKNPYVFGDGDEARKKVESLVENRGVPVKVLNTTKPNILIIVLESFGSALVGPLGGDSLATPNFNRLAEEGVLFTNFYASGNRTDKAMPAIVSGYPAQPAVSIMKEPKKTQSLPGIIKAMTSQGYNSAFWYGGEINFANFNSYIINSGFGQMVTMDDFSPEFYNSKWGVHDHIFLETFADSMKNPKEPFIKVLLTLSSHEPFEVPMEPVFIGNDNVTKFKNSIYYTDKALGEFINMAKQTRWWENTLVIMLADHCLRSSVDVLAYSEDIFRIPMLWTGGAVAEKGLKVNKYGSQTDLPVTLLHQMGLEDVYPFGKDLLVEENSSFAFYTFNEGFAFLTDSSKYIWDHKLGAPVVESGKNPETAGAYGKAFLQTLYDDFLKR